VWRHWFVHRDHQLHPWQRLVLLRVVLMLSLLWLLVKLQIQPLEL
jgi:hypothetical protein